MHITLETDYAIRIVDCLARYNGRMGAKLLADEVCVTLRFSLKILRKLVTTGIVRSFKGTQGGYELARPTRDVSLYDVLETIEGPFVFNRCLCDDFDCSQFKQKDCPYYDIFAELTNDVQGKLRSITLASILGEPEEEPEPDPDDDDELELEWEPELTMQR